MALQPESLPWTVSTVLSVLYFVFYFKNILDHEASCDYAPSGFCVTNYVPDVPGEKPHKEGLCPSRFANSHFWAFTVDVLFTIGVLFIGYNPKIFKEQQGRGNAIRLALVITFHGGLHFLLGYVLHAVRSCAQRDLEICDGRHPKHGNAHLPVRCVHFRSRFREKRPPAVGR